MVRGISERLDTVFADLQFDDQRHLYYVNGIQYPSVSSKVEGSCEKFDAEKILPWSARKEGVAVDELRERWKKTNKDACELGTETHNFLELFNGAQSTWTPYQDAGVNFIRDILKDYEIVYRELRMYSRVYKYAGTTDLILRKRSTGRYAIADYKTNKDLFKTYGFLKPPFQYLESHPYNKYQLQLSYYQIPLEEVSLPVDERLLVHLKPDATYKIYNTFDLTNEIRTYLSTEQPKKEKSDYLW